MNREIKLRIWNKNKKMWCPDDHDIDYESCPLGIEIKPDREDVVLMQSTGLKDKNGKEVYEGDIVRGNGLINAVIIYEESETSFLADAGFAKLKFANNRLIEIIGNIYENGDLLKSENPAD